MTATQAAPRDASLLARPNTRTVKRLHIVRDGSAACASPAGWSSRCNSMLDLSMSVPATDVPATLRCQRPGCRVRWPARLTEETANLQQTQDRSQVAPQVEIEGADHD